MRKQRRLLPLVLGLALGTAAHGEARAQQLLWGSTRGELALPERPTESAHSIELADDFEAWGEIGAVVVDGLACAECAAPRLGAVELRFWRWRAERGPGELEAEIRLDAGDLGLTVDSERPGKLSLRLATPFAARGRHFLSVRLEFETIGAWSWWSAAGKPRLEPAWLRSETEGWSPAPSDSPIGVDLAFELTTSPWDDFALARGCGRLEVEAPPAPLGALPWRLVDVAAVDGERAWAVGVADAPEGRLPLLFERAKGAWSPLAAPLPVGARLSAVAAVSEKEIWFVGSAPYAPGPLPETRQPLAVRYLPTTGHWEILPTPVYLDGDAELLDVVATEGEGIWAVGSAVIPVGDAVERVALALRHDGAAFERIPVAGRPSTGEGLTAIAAAGGRIWAVGGDGAGAIARNLLVARWNGRELERVAVPGLDRVDRLAAVALDADQVWLGGLTGGGDAVLVRFDGLAWQEHPSAVGGAALAADAKGFVTAGAGLASFVDGKWRPEPDGPAVAFGGLAAPRPCALFAAGSHAASTGERGLVLRLVPRGFADGFESGGFEAWTLAVP